MQHQWTRGAVALCAGIAGLISAVPARAQFDSDKVSLYKWFPVADFGAGEGNDCWGYVSSSGREYALMGLDNKTAIVEISDPANAFIVGTVSHTRSGTSDIKVYRDYAYVANGNGGGIDIIDLSNVDSGNIRLVKRLTDNGMQASHNIAIDPDSGFLYLAVGNINNGAMVAWDLSDPENPFIAGQYNGSRSHDLAVYTYTSGQYAGRQIAFSASEGRGFDVIDVTNKSNMFRMSRTTYPGLGYCHQSWLSEDRTLLYLGDEFDEAQRGWTTRTFIFDVTNLNNPVLLNTVTTGRDSIDHNQYVKDGFLFQANYTSGMWIYDLRTDPANPTIAGFFDTYPNGDPIDFAGAWTAYPYFPSGTVIVSDRDRGLFVLDPREALGGGQIPCQDIKKLAGKCKANGTVKAKVRMTDGSHNGQKVTIDINGTSEQLVIAGKRAKTKICCFGGTVTIALTDPPDCIAPINVDCP